MIVRSRKSRHHATSGSLRFASAYRWDTPKARRVCPAAIPLLLLKPQMIRTSVAVLLLATSLPGVAAAQADRCPSRVISRGNPVTGRTLSLSYEYPDLSPAEVFISLRAALESPPEALIPRTTIQNADSDRGVITGQQVPRGAARPIGLEATVVALPSGTTQVTISNRSPAGFFIAAAQWAQSYCSFLAGLRSDAPGRGASPAADPAAPAPAGLSVTEANAVAQGFPIGILVRGELATPGERDIYPLTVASPDTFVYDLAFEPGGSSGFLGPNDFVQVRIRNTESREDVARAGLSLGGGHTAVSPFLLAPGRYQILVGKTGSNGPARLPYGLRLSRYRQSVEAGSTTLAPGVPFEGRLEYPGDLDIFTFRAERGQEVRVRAELLDPWTKYRNVDPAWLMVSAVDPRGNVSVRTQLTPTIRSVPFTNWVQVNQGGVHRIEVDPWLQSTANNPYWGRYRVTVEIRD
jgi:hypothetical protein